MFGAALRHHQAGRLPEAERLYRQVLAADPGHADALHLLGLIAYQVGRHDVAVDLIGRAVGLKGDVALYHNHMGLALRERGEHERAVSHYRRALSLAPDHVEALTNLGAALIDLDRLDEAVAHLERAVAQSPQSVEALGNLGTAHRARGALDEAIDCYRRALALGPDHADLRTNLGNALKDRGDLEEAVAEYERAIALRPDDAEIYSNLGNALRDQGKLGPAVTRYERAIALRPDYAEAYNNLGNALQEQGRLAQAVAVLERAIALQPGHARAHNNLGNALKDQGRLDEAVTRFEQALALKPDYAVCMSNLLLTVNYAATMDLGSYGRIHADIGGRMEAPFLGTAPTHANSPDPSRPLRVGYVSPDFRTHSVAFFFEPLLRGHDRSAVDVFCYAEVKRPDAVTARLRDGADRWLSTVGLSDNALAERIRADGIDILVDLAGHTAGNRLPVFARRPAPVQVAWLGYPATTGLTAIDHHLTDDLLTPANGAEYFSERPWSLPRCSFAYAPPSVAAQVGPLPMDGGTPVAFGSFNNLSKLGPATIDLWSQVLAGVPGSRLILKGTASSDPATITGFERRFAAGGISPERLVWLPYAATPADHLRRYDQIDIALDPTPYNGNTTTCEALWMGVPVVTLAGDRMVSRHGATLLKAVGLDDLVAASPGDFVAIARTLATSPVRLRELREGLRPRMAASPLCDGATFARAVEEAFRGMWRRWCDGRSRQGLQVDAHPNWRRVRR